ncbi:hypothetical protein ACHAPT_005443 [Fusarium lateritium]
MAVEEESETKKKALVVRMGKNHQDEKPLALDSIIVQNSSLKKTLGQVFEGYQGITTSLKKLVFKAPFRPFYFRWKQLATILEHQNQHDQDAAAYTQLLYDVLHDELHEQITEINDLLDHGVITYERFWALFEPGTSVLNVDDGDERFFVVIDCQYNHQENHSLVTVKYVNWDGERFGYQKGTLKVREFSGTRKLTELEVYPASLLPSPDETRSRLIARGRRFHGLHGVHHKAYSGRVTFTDLHKDKDEEDLHLDARARHGKQEDGVKEEADADYLTDEQLLLCSSTVQGYSLKTKLWCEFNVNHISDITWNDDVFSKLLLPAVYKNLMLSFVEDHTANKPAFDDIVEGKGLGIIILLLGSPGIGKTLTAEAVAEKVHRPLYLLSAGELGREAYKVESKLNSVLKMAEDWDAIVLLDECDVFLQERSMDHLAHNEIVAVFLRVLEYYRGLLIMTSNRSKAIDPAFQSRIHLTLHYPELDKARREQIWRRFSAKAGQQNGLDDSAYERLSRLPMNGREIRNAVKISILLAQKEETELELEQIRTALQVSREAGDSGLKALDTA